MFSPFVGDEKPFKDVFGDVVAHELGILFEGQRFE